MRSTCRHAVHDGPQSGGYMSTGTDSVRGKRGDILWNLFSSPHSLESLRERRQDRTRKQDTANKAACSKTSNNSADACMETRMRIVRSTRRLFNKPEQSKVTPLEDRILARCVSDSSLDLTKDGGVELRRGSATTTF